MLLLLLLLADVAAAEPLVTRDGRVAIVVVLETKELLVATFSLRASDGRHHPSIAGSTTFSSSLVLIKKRSARIPEDRISRRKRKTYRSPIENDRRS